MEKELKKILETLNDDFSAAKQEVDDTSLKEGLKWQELLNSKNGDGTSVGDFYKYASQRKNALVKNLNDIYQKNPVDIKKADEILSELNNINKFIDTYQTKEKEYINRTPDGKRALFRKKAKEIIANKLENSRKLYDDKIDSVKAEFNVALDRLKQDPGSIRLQNDFDEKRNILNNLINERNVLINLQNYDGLSWGEKVKKEIFGNLDPNSEIYKMFKDYYELIKEYGNIPLNKKEKLENNYDSKLKDKAKNDNNGNGDGNKNNSGNDNPPAKDINPPINSLKVYNQEVKVPKNVSKKPDKTWKTVVAVALGGGIAVGAFAAFGVVGSTVVMTTSGIGRTLIKRQEKKLNLLEEKANLNVKRALDIKNKSTELVEQIDGLKEKYNALEPDKDEEREKINKEIEDVNKKIEEYNKAQERLTQEAMTIYEKVWPDLKNEKFNGPKKITNINDAKEKIKAKANKFKAYLGSKEGLRDARWLANTAFLTSAGLMVSSKIAAAIQTHGPTITSVDTPSNPVHAPNNSINPSSDSILSGIKEGGSVDGYNLSVGHDSASWAVNGEHTENLLSQYVNGQNSIFNKFGFVDKAGNFTKINLNGMNLQDFLSANPQIDPASVVADVASQSGTSQAWISLEELTSGLGGIKL